MTALRYLFGSAALLLVGALLMTRVELQIAAPEVAPSVVRVPPATALNVNEATLNTDLGALHLAFAADDTQVIAAIDLPVSPQYLLLADGWGLHVRLAWRAHWLPQQVGHAKIELALYARLADTPDAAFVLWEQDSKQLYEEGNAAYEGELGIWLYPDEAAPKSDAYDLRIEAIVTEFDDRTDAERVLYEAGQDLRLYMLPWPDWVPQESEWATPRFGNQAANGQLLDWRGWHFGPCDLPDDHDEAGSMFALACEASGRDDFEAVYAHLLDAVPSLDAAGDAWLYGTVQDQLGVLAATADSWPAAAAHFEQAQVYWLLEAASFELGVTLHNLALATWYSGDFEAATAPLLGAQSLREQYGDEIGTLLTWAQTSIFYEDWEDVYLLVEWLDEKGLPQADLLAEWLDDRDL